LALIAHLCHGEKLSDQRYATLRSVTKASRFKPSSNQVVLHTHFFAMMAIKTARCWSHSRSHSHAKTFDDKPTTQKRTTSSDELQIQSWSIKRWANIHTKQATSKKGTATSSEFEAHPVSTSSGSNKNNSIWAHVRHIIYSTFDGWKPEAVRDYDNEDSRCSEICDNANSTLNLDGIAILEFGSRQPSTKQLAKESQYMRQAILISKCGHPHPVKTTLNYQRTAATAGNRVMPQMTTAHRLILKGVDKIQVNGRRPMI
jgi:hypothetical protein